MNIAMQAMKRIVYDPMARLEDALAARPDAIRATENSPVRFDIVLQTLRTDGGKPPLTTKTAPHMFASRRGILRSLRSIEDNPVRMRTTMSPAALSALEAYAHSLGVAAIGYTKLPRHLIFQDKAVLFDNAMVLVMEMDKEKIEGTRICRRWDSNPHEG